MRPAHAVSAPESPASTAAAATSAAQPIAPAFKAHLDFKFVKDNLELVLKNVQDRASSADARRVVQLYDEFAQLKQEADQLRAQRNENSNAMKVVHSMLVTGCGEPLADSKAVTGHHTRNNAMCVRCAVCRARWTPIRGSS